MRILLPIALIASTFAAPVVLTLGGMEGENVITIKATVNNSLSDTATTVYSGTIKIDLTVIDDEATTFEMTGGKIFATDTIFLFEIENFFSQTVTFESLTATPVSPSGPESRSPPGQFSAPAHYLLFNQGCLVSEGSFGNSKTLVQDDPFPAAGSTMGTITPGPVEEIQSSITNEVIATSRLIELVLPLNSTATSGDEDFTLATETTGTVTAAGTLLEFTHPFFEWATANAPLAGTAISFTTDADHDGQQDGISWALGFAAGASSKNIQPIDHSLTGELTFDLPGPTRRALTLQKSATLSADDWSPVAGYDPIPAGTTGALTLPLDDGTTFYRFTATPD